MVGGVERYFQIAPCFRDEASRADRSPGEFYQIDLEMAFATQEDVFAEVELLMARDRGRTARPSALPSEFPRLRFAEAIDRFGTDKPDLRFGLEIADVTGWAGGNDRPADAHRGPGAGARDPGAARPGRRGAAPQVV